MEKPVGMILQQRDEDINKAVYEYGGVLTGNHLREMFWKSTRTDRAMRRRLTKLCQAGYLARPTPVQRRFHYIPKSSVYWLGWRGALEVAGNKGIYVVPPKTISAYQLRLLRNRLKQERVYWLSTPHWNSLAHDLKLLDFRLVIEREVDLYQQLQIDNCIHETTFRSDSDQIKIKGKNKKMWIDLHFEIVDKTLKEKGEAHRARFNLEYETGSRDNPKFGIDKVLPPIKYVDSAAYKTRFGANHGLWLIVVSGREKMKNRILRTKQVAGTNSSLFFFTTEAKFKSGRPLTSPIWQQVGEKNPFPLIQT